MMKFMICYSRMAFSKGQPLHKVGVVIWGELYNPGFHPGLSLVNPSRAQGLQKHRHNPNNNPINQHRSYRAFQDIAFHFCQR